MNKINSIEEILQQIAKIRGLRKGFVTNFYLDLFKHSIWIKENVLNYECIEDTLFIIKKNDEGFWNVFYCSTNHEELEKAIKIFVDKYNEETLMFDIVGNNDYCTKITDVFKRCQCKEYCSLVRMERMTTEIDYDASFEKVTYATKEQAKEV